MSPLTFFLPLFYRSLSFTPCLFLSVYFSPTTHIFEIHVVFSWKRRKTYEERVWVKKPIVVHRRNITFFEDIFKKYYFSHMFSPSQRGNLQFFCILSRGPVSYRRTHAIISPRLIIYKNKYNKLRLFFYVFRSISLALHLGHKINLFRDFLISFINDSLNLSFFLEDSMESTIISSMVNKYKWVIPPTPSSPTCQL
jgi:hypothetical protein